jgi:molybdopterin-guanine dinucleotide biosynthesis protein A
MTSPFTVAISAGGQSSRMGTDKSFVEIAGQPVIERVLSRVADLGQHETILITNRPEDYAHLGLPMYVDVMPGKGSLGGIYTALQHSTQPHTLVVACDMPFLSEGLLRYMLNLIEDTVDVIVPRVDKYPQGLHAVYGQACLGPIKERLDVDRLKVIGFYGKVRVRYLDEDEYKPFDPDGRAFMNINTPDDLEEAHRLAANDG